MLDHFFSGFTCQLDRYGEQGSDGENSQTGLGQL